MKNIIEDIKKELKAFYEDTIVPLKMKIVRTMKETVSSALKEMKEQRIRFYRNISESWKALSTTYFIHVHPHVAKLFRVVYYYYLVIWRTGREAVMYVLRKMIPFLEYVGKKIERFLNVTLMDILVNIAKFLEKIIHFILLDIVARSIEYVLKKIWPAIKFVLEPLWNHVIYPFLKFSWKRFVSIVKYIISSFEELGKFLWSLIRGIVTSFPAFCRDLIYVTIGAPIYLYRKIRTKKQ